MIGIEALVIGLNGNVTSGNSCFNELVHGNINKMIKKVVDGLISQTWCSCIADTEKGRNLRSNKYVYKKVIIASKRKFKKEFKRIVRRTYYFK